MLLKGKTALLTGSNKGLGLDILKKLSHNGCNIIACTRKKDLEFDDIIKKLSNENKNKITNLNFDISDSKSIDNSLSEAIKNFKDIDFLINNAGVIHNSLFMMTPLKKIEEVLRVNLISVIQITQIVAKKMIQKKSGLIINISSSSAKENNFGRSIYSSSKNAIESITKSLSKELGRFNIRANCISPGLIDTDMLRKNTSKDNIEKTIKRISSGKIGIPEDVSNLILFLCSDEAKYINGEVISIDGGLTLDGW